MSFANYNKFQLGKYWDNIHHSNKIHQNIMYIIEERYNKHIPMSNLYII